jgi:hypothetical protein
MSKPGTSPAPAENAFTRLAALAKKSKTIRLVPDGDVVDVHHDKGVDGRIVKTRVETVAAAQASEFEIIPLTPAQKEIAESYTDSVLPPAIYVEERSARPDVPPKQVHAGYDEASPSYLNNLRNANARKAAFTVLCGVVGLADSLQGDDAAKVKMIMETLPDRVVTYLANEIWSITWATGDPGDFFTKAG